jgi:hypothetical protein
MSGSTSVTQKWKHFVARMDNLEDHADVKMLVNELRCASHGSLVFYIMSLKTEIEVLTVLLKEFEKSSKIPDDIGNAPH